MFIGNIGETPNMCHLISAKITSYDCPQTVKVADKTYNNISESSVKDLIDADKNRKQVYYLEGKDSSFVSYVQGNKVTRSTEYFHEPISKRLGDKFYSNITSKCEIAGTNYHTYVVESPIGGYNQVRLYKSGHVLDVNEFTSKVLMRKITSPLKKLAQIIR